ncbi:o-succinylbenzoate synthase [Horticoccus sp. 23ND18S-11]|uniref:o-succinylbenzoate synthase n=1 Tax=Horticoccus sp. 23ND18S-11 TaxID=3391832 RepID=UPI0039C8F8B2
MKVRLQLRRYRLPFRAPVRTAHGVWTQREGLIVRLEGEGGGIGWGEVAPIPHFGTETADEAEAAARTLDEWTTTAALAEVPERLGCLRHGLQAALREVEAQTRAAADGAEPEAIDASAPYLGVAALLPAGRAALALIEPRAEIGFRMFKWKVGVADIAEELPLLDDVCARLPSGAKLRLDANGAWERRHAERWLERCADRPVEFIEQPCLAEISAFARAIGEKVTGAQRKEMDLLLGLAEDFPTPIALDESLVGEGDIERWVGAGWPGVYVVKPSLLGDVTTAMTRLAQAKAQVVFSSALETAVGARTALQLAFAWKGEPAADGKTPARALGFGVWPLFADARFDGPGQVPFIRREDVARMNPEAIWTALG